MSKTTRSASMSATAAATSPTTSTSTRCVAAVERRAGRRGGPQTTMFTCSDATPAGDHGRTSRSRVSTASSSPPARPSSTRITFRDVAKRAGLNPYQYTQVNIREQCSWTHTDDHEGATDKAIRLVKAGIARTRLTEPLEPIVVETTPRTLVVGGGIAGLRAALGLADIGLGVFLVETRAAARRLGRRLRRDVPARQERRELIGELEEEGAATSGDHRVHRGRDGQKSGSFGNYRSTSRIDGESPRRSVEVGLHHRRHRLRHLPARGRRVRLRYRRASLTLPEFKKLVDERRRSADARRPAGGTRRLHLLRGQPPGGRRARGHDEYCSRYCCTAAVHASLAGSARCRPGRTSTTSTATCAPTASTRLLYTESRRAGLGLIVKFPDDEPPTVARREGGGLLVTVRDLLTDGEEWRSRPTWSSSSPAWSRGRTKIWSSSEAARRQGRLLQRDPSQAAPGRDGRRRRVHRRRLPGAEELGRERGLRAGGGDAERGHPQEGLRRTRSARRGRRRRRLHGLGRSVLTPAPMTPSP